MAQIDLGIDGYPLDPSQPDAFHQRQLDSWLARGNPNTLPPAIDLRDKAAANEWLLPMVRRHAWIHANRELLPLAPAWKMNIESLLTLALNHLWDASLPPDTLVAIAEIAPGTDLLRHNLHDFFSLIKTWTPELRAEVHRLLPSIEVTPYCLLHPPALAAWTLFLDLDHDAGDDSTCWSATVRRDLLQMPADKRDRWLRFFKVAPKVPHGKWQFESGRAIKALGETACHTQAEAWLKLLAEQPSHLEFAGCLLLQLLLELTHYPLEPQWADARSRQFWRLLAPRYKVRARSTAIPKTCIDGFPLQDFPKQTTIQAAIDAEMRIDKNDPHAVLKRLRTGDDALLGEALRNRIAWVEANTPPFDGQPNEQWVRMFGYATCLKAVHSALLNTATGLGEEAIAAALGQGTMAAFERAAAYTREHGYRPAIVAAVRKMHETLHGTVAGQSARKHVGWWLWLDDATPIDPAECWTGVIRADLRAVPPDLKKRWLAVVGNMTFQIGARIPAKWSKTANKALAALGADAFHARIQTWFGTLADATKPQPLSTPGSDLLRCLLWDYSLLDDRRPETDAAFRRLTTAKWKNKQARDRALKLTPILESLFPEAQLPGRPEPKPPALPNLQDPAEALRFMLRSHPEAARIEAGPDAILVHGDRDQYRVSYDGQVTGRSGHKIQLDLTTFPGANVWQSAIDQEDLKQGMFGINLPRLIFIVSILAADRHFAGAID